MMMSLKSSHTVAALFSLLMFLSFKLSNCIANISAITICHEMEKQSLLSFKQSLQDPSNLLSSWNGAEVNCCKWKGVVCSNSTGHVHELHLQISDLSGKINPSLLNLKHLKYLDLSQNNFDETIFPSFLGSLTSLEYLNLSGAGFYGKIPYSIANLSNLHSLELEDNSLDVDSLEWLSGLSKLEHLNMNRVNLSRATNWTKQVMLPSLLELHFSSCSLNDFASPMHDTHYSDSNIAILDLSSNNFHSLNLLTKWVLRLSNLILLDLSRNSFQGPIPTISNTPNIKHIDLSYNHFNSSIPEWIYCCKDLEFLNLGVNHLQNAISNSIANLTSLNTLDLSDNELSGKIPREIASLCKMKMLNLHANKLQGEISVSFGNMSTCFLGSLVSLDLRFNQLSGHLTHQFGEFKSLRDLSVGMNLLGGVIPYNIGNLSSLESLYLTGNKLIGNLPESMGQLLNLESLHISDNMLQGIVTENHFAHLSKLRYLFASRSRLIFKVSQGWVPPFKLEILRLGSSNLGSGSRIPSWIETQKSSITELDLSSTGISGNVPSWIWNIHSLNLSNNQLSGKIPVISDTEAGNYDWGRLVYLSSNKFSGPLPKIGYNVTELDLSNNSLSEGMSHFLCTENDTYRLEILHLGGNHLSGELPECWVKWTSLIMLNLGNNNLSGRIPNSIGFLASLQSLNLYGNKFSGHIPFSLHNCTMLEMMDLAHNDFDGSIPTWAGTRLSELKFLILRSNKLSGEITSAICQLSSLQILDLSNNRFSGTIPRCVNNFTAMTTKGNLFVGRPGYSMYYGVFLESASIATKGKELTYDTILSLVTNIDLSKNNLSGNIPEEITSLVELRSLNLSGNHLTGLIPDGIGNMKQLESVDFSVNSLSGEIPSSFTIMTSLNYLNLSYNNFTGKIPESTQILGLTSSSFIGNSLCGPPLTISCSNGGKASGPAHSEDHDDENGDKSEIVWLYLFTSLGYAVGLSAFLTAWVLKKSWRDACYELVMKMVDNAYAYLYVKWRRLTIPSASNS